MSPLGKRLINTMRLFLIDYENVNSAGLHGIGQAEPDDRFILFYSREANTLSFEIMDEMIGANIMPERVCLEHSGKNALDFQLVTFLGYLIAKEKADTYYIISRDSGFRDPVLPVLSGRQGAPEALDQGGDRKCSEESKEKRSAAGVCGNAEKSRQGTACPEKGEEG